MMNYAPFACERGLLHNKNGSEIGPSGLFRSRAFLKNDVSVYSNASAFSLTLTIAARISSMSFCVPSNRLWPSHTPSLVLATSALGKKTLS